MLVHLPSESGEWIGNKPPRVIFPGMRADSCRFAEVFGKPRVRMNETKIQWWPIFFFIVELKEERN